MKASGNAYDVLGWHGTTFAGPFGRGDGKQLPEHDSDESYSSVREEVHPESFATCAWLSHATSMAPPIVFPTSVGTM